MFIDRKFARAKSAIRTRRYALYTINFFFAFHLALVTYYTSSFLLSRGVPETHVGTFFMIGAGATLAALALAPRVIRLLGNYTTLLLLAVLETIVFASFALGNNLLSLALLFALFSLVPAVLSLTLDLYLEENTGGEEETGRVRTFYITAANVAFVVAPSVGGFLLGANRFGLLFTASAFLMIPATIVALIYLRTTSYGTPNAHIRIGTVMRRILQDTSLRAVFVAQFLLRLFYTTMVIYTPLYLSQHLHFSFAEVGLISTTMLIAFVLIEIPAGTLADERFGEKELLMLGLLITGLSTAMLGLVTAHTIIVWGAMLFITRIGAALIESMSESHFFKCAKAEDAELVSAFRALPSLAYIIGPLCGSLLLTLGSFTTLFIALGALMFVGIPFVLSMHDSR